MDSFFYVNPNIFPIFPFSPANSNTVKTVESDSSDINSQIIGEWVWNSNNTHKLVVSCKKHDGTVINRFVDLDNRIGVGEKFTSGTLLNIIKQMSNGIHMALVSETVSDIPFSDIENYIIVFKGTSYGDPYTRIMAFPMSQSSAPKWGMVFWDSSRIVWV